MDVADKVIRMLSAEIDALEAQGVSERWVGKKEGRDYLFWTEGDRNDVRSARIYEGVQAAKDRHNRWLWCRWLRAQIDQATRTKPKRGQSIAG